MVMTMPRPTPVYHNIIRSIQMDIHIQHPVVYHNIIRSNQMDILTQHQLLLTKGELLQVLKFSHFSTI